MVKIGLDFSLFIQAVNVLALTLFLNYFLYKPLRGILKERADILARLKDRVAAFKSEIDNGETEKARLNAESLRLAMNLKNDLTAKSGEQGKALLAEAQDKAARQLNESRLKLRRQAAEARTALAAETESLARTMAEKILGRSL